MCFPEGWGRKQHQESSSSLGNHLSWDHPRGSPPSPGGLPRSFLGSPRQPGHHCPHLLCETPSAFPEPKVRSPASDIPTWTKELPALPSKSYLITGSTIKEALEPEEKGLAGSGQSIHHGEQFCRGASAADSSLADTPVLLPCQHRGCLHPPAAQTLQR